MKGQWCLCEPSCLSLQEVDRLGLGRTKRFQSFNLYEKTKLRAEWQSPLLRSTGDLCTTAGQIKVLLSEQANSISITDPLFYTPPPHPTPQTFLSRLEQDACAREYTPSSHPHLVNSPTSHAFMHVHLHVTQPSNRACVSSTVRGARASARPFFPVGSGQTNVSSVAVASLLFTGRRDSMKPVLLHHTSQQDLWLSS